MTLPAPVQSGPDSDDGSVCKVVICDHQMEMRDAIRFTLEPRPHYRVVAEAGDANGCLHSVRETRPDLLILDVNIPSGGPRVAAAAKNIHPGLHIVVFSGRTDPAIAQAMLAAGADQYVLKTGRVEPLLQAVENAHHQLTRALCRPECSLEPRMPNGRSAP